MKVFRFVILVSPFLSIWAFPRQYDNAKNGQRIVGGGDATIEEYPYIAQLYLDNSYQCGACIISTKWVLTAGHCTEGENTNTVTLRVGASKFSQVADEAIAVAEIHIHPQYNTTTLDYDICALLLAKDLTFGTTIASVPLPSANVVVTAGTMTTIIGWGYLNETTEVYPTQLQKVSVPIVSNEVCSVSYTGMSPITDRMLCAGYDKGGKDSCGGDSGGPLTVDGVLYGMVSMGVGCALAGYPGIYANVSSVRSFIQDVTGL